MCSSLTLIYLDSLRLFILNCLLSQKTVSDEIVIELCNQTQRTVDVYYSRVYFKVAISGVLFLSKVIQNSFLHQVIGAS